MTGASGFLGVRTVRALVGEGHEVVALSRHPGSDTSGAREVSADLCAKSTVAKVLRNAGPLDCIVHLASAVPRNQSQDTLSTYEANILGTANLLDASGAELPALVFASTTELYGSRPPGSLAVDESGPTDPPTFYAASKLAGEQLCRTFVKRDATGCALSILRFTVLYGEGDEIDRALPNFLRRAVLREPLCVFGGEDRRDYLHVDEAARAILCAVEATREGTFNIASGATTSIVEAAQQVAKLAGTGAPVEVLPARGVTTHLVLDVTAASKHLGFSAQKLFPEGIAEWIEAFRGRSA